MTDTIEARIGKTNLRADPGSITFGGMTLLWDQVDAISYVMETVSHGINGVTTSKTQRRTFTITGAGTKIRVDASVPEKDGAALDAWYKPLCELADQIVVPRIAGEMLRQLETDGQVVLGSVTVRKSGLAHKGPLGGVKYLPWDAIADVQFLPYGGTWAIRAKRGEGKRAATFASLPYQEMNLPPFLRLLNYCRQNLA
jgi:hypothetical protein